MKFIILVLSAFLSTALADLPEGFLKVNPGYDYSRVMALLDQHDRDIVNLLNVHSTEDHFVEFVWRKISEVGMKWSLLYKTYYVKGKLQIYPDGPFYACVIYIVQGYINNGYRDYVNVREPEKSLCQLVAGP